MRKAGALPQVALVRLLSSDVAKVVLVEDAVKDVGDISDWSQVHSPR